MSRGKQRHGHACVYGRHAFAAEMDDPDYAETAVDLLDEMIASGD